LPILSQTNPIHIFTYLLDHERLQHNIRLQNINKVNGHNIPSSLSGLPNYLQFYTKINTDYLFASSSELVVPEQITSTASISIRNVQNNTLCNHLKAE
jgi:hypothetical protein